MGYFSKSEFIQTRGLLHMNSVTCDAFSPIAQELNCLMDYTILLITKSMRAL